MLQKQIGRAWNISSGAASVFSHRLAYVMELRGVVAQDIGRAIGIDCGKIRSWMRGDSAPRLASFSKLCVFLNVSADWMLEIGGEPPTYKHPAVDGWLP